MAENKQIICQFEVCIFFFVGVLCINYEYDDDMSVCMMMGTMCKTLCSLPSLYSIVKYLLHFLQHAYGRFVSKQALIFQ